MIFHRNTQYHLNEPEVSSVPSSPSATQGSSVLLEELGPSRSHRSLSNEIVSYNEGHSSATEQSIFVDDSPGGDAHIVLSSSELIVAPSDDTDAALTRSLTPRQGHTHLLPEPISDAREDEGA